MTTQTDQRDCCDTTRDVVHAPDCPRRTLAQTIAQSLGQQTGPVDRGEDISL